MVSKLEGEINEIIEFRARLREEIGDAHEAILRKIFQRVREYEKSLFDSYPIQAGFVIINQWRDEDQLLRNQLFEKQAQLAKLEGDSDVG